MKSPIEGLCSRRDLLHVASTLGIGLVGTASLAQAFAGNSADGGPLEGLQPG
jgi:hypothetical protein